MEKMVTKNQLPAEIRWEMLDKSRFFILGAALFSSVSAALYPAVVLKTRVQIAHPPLSCTRAAAAILRHEGPAGFYRGLATSLAGTIPARALYMSALELTKSSAFTAAARLGAPEPAAVAAASAVAGVSAAVAAQVVWTPVDVVSQRLMVQGGSGHCRYHGGADAFKKILLTDGIGGLYRGFGTSILMYAPSNAVWWMSYSLMQRLIWSGFGGDGRSARYRTVVAVQGVSAAAAGGAAAMVTMPLDTIKTRMQVVEDGAYPTIRETVRRLVREGGWGACYRGLGPRWVSAALSGTTMITTYEFLKHVSARSEE